MLTYTKNVLCHTKILFVKCVKFKSICTLCEQILATSVKEGLESMKQSQASEAAPGNQGPLVSRPVKPQASCGLYPISL